MGYRFHIGLLFVLMPIFVYGDFSTRANQALRCMFMNTLPSPCHTDEGSKIPLNLVKTFNDLPQSIQVSLENGELDNLTDTEFASLPTVFLSLLPVDRLSKLSVSKLVRVIATHPNEVSLAVHMVSAVKTSQQKLVFIEQIRDVNTSTEVQRVLAEAIIEMDLSNITQLPFLLHMPPRYLLQLNNSEVHQIYNHLPTQATNLTPLEIRIWASLSLNERFSLKQFDWLLTGFTEEELGNISNTPDKFNIDFSIVQARAVFEKFYENKVLTRINIAESASLLSKLTPSMLQRFPQALQDYYSEIKHLSSPFSVATAKQIMEFIIATSLERNKLGMNRSMWRERIQYLNKWVYVLPPSVLKQYARFTTLTPTILNKIQSEMLTNVQAYYLTNKGLSMNLSIPSSIMTNKDNLLSALPTTQLLEHPMGSFQSTVLEHILVHLPDKNVPRMVSLLAKIFTSFDSDEEFCNLLENKAVNAYFNLISSSIIQQSSDDILLKIWKLKYSHLPIIQQLPPRILSILLRSAKQDDTWTWENFINSSQPLYVLINGINCDHVLNIATTDFITIMAYYNQKRENFKKVFPKNLQYCCLQKLMEYLQLKMELQHTNLDEGIISLLGPMEIEAIGGYVLLGLPTEAIKENKHTKHILAAIGKLSVAELLIATNLPKLKELALLAIRYMFTPTFADYFELGNLLWFVNHTLLPANTTATLKLAIESQILDKRLCLNAEERNALATFLIQIFGPPESWSRGKLAILGDLLLVFPEENLLKVNETSWVDAADTLHSNYYDIVEWTQPTPFYKVCMAVLEQIEEEAYLSDVKRLVRWRLRAAERQLSTVYIAFNESNTESNKIHRPISKIQSDTRIKVYSFSEEEEEEEYSTTEDYSAEYDPDTTETTDMNDFSTKESTTEISTTETEKYSSNNIKEDKTTEAIQNKTTKSTRDITKTIDVYDQTTKVFSQETMNTFTTDTIKLSSIETPSTNTTNIEQSITIEISTKTMDTDLLKTIIAQSDIEPTSTINDSITQRHKVDQYLSTITKSTTKVPETNRKIMLFLNNTENSTDTTHIINMTQPNSDRLKNISTNFATEKNFHLSVNEGVTETVPNNKTKIFTNVMENESERIKTVTMPSNNRETSTVVIENEVRDLQLNTSQSLITTRLPVITDATTIQLLNLSTTVKMNLTHIDNKITENITTEVVEEVSGELVPEPHDSILNLEKYGKTRTRRSVFINWSSIKFSCDAVKMVGDIAALSLSSEDIDNMEHSELIDCGETLGRLDLPEDVLTNIWSRLDEREPIHLMGNLLKAIKFVDVFNMKMNPSVPWILETISAFSQHITDSYLIGIVIEDFKNRNDLEVINVETLAALNSLICLLDIEKIPNIRQRFHNITVLLGTSAECPTCVSKLAEIVVSPDGFGNIDRWEVEDVETMGSIIAGLNDTQWNDLLQSPKHLLSGLQPNAIRCLSSKQLKMIPKDMFSLIPPLTLAGISEEKLSQLSLQQTSIIQDVKNLKIWTDIMPKKKKNILVAGYPMSSSCTMHEVSFVYLTFLIISAFVFI